jgi:hypothetical protein
VQAAGNTAIDNINTWLAARIKKTDERNRGEAREYYGIPSYEGNVASKPTRMFGRVGSNTERIGSCFALIEAGLM